MAARGSGEKGRMAGIARRPCRRSGLLRSGLATRCDDPTASRKSGALKFFDAGDVQANGFQIIADDQPFQTFTESGASYMGFAVSALLAQPLARKGRYGVAFTGNGSFMMNPEVLIDGVEHGVHGTSLLFDNRRMAAISSLQDAQYGVNWRTNDSVAVDYITMARPVPCRNPSRSGGGACRGGALFSALGRHPGMGPRRHPAPCSRPVARPSRRSGASDVHRDRQTLGRSARRGHRIG